MASAVYPMLTKGGLQFQLCEYEYPIYSLATTPSTDHDTEHPHSVRYLHTHACKKCLDRGVSSSAFAQCKTALLGQDAICQVPAIV